MQKTCSPPPNAVADVATTGTTTAGTAATTGGATGTGAVTAGGTAPVPFGMSARAWAKGAMVPKSGFEWVEADGCADLLLKVHDNTPSSAYYNTLTHTLTQITTYLLRAF